jgi:hypothetical protein
MLIRSLSLLLLLAAGAFAGGKVILIEASPSGMEESRYLIIESADSAFQSEVAAGIEAIYPRAVFAMAGTGPETGSRPPIVVHKRGGFMSGDKAAGDLILGVSLCAGSCVFINVAGEDMNSGPPPDGLIATAGDKYVSGPAACLPGAGIVAALFFSAKGFFELFMPKSTSDYSEIKVPESHKAAVTAETLLSGGQLAVRNRVEFEVNDTNREAVRREIVQYAVTLP